jgi:hypothetical protein
MKVTRWPIIQKVRSHGTKSAPTACMHTVSGSISLPSPGFFSPFPHGTSSLSVSREYLALEDGPPIFNQDFTCPDLLFVTHLTIVLRTGLSPFIAGFSKPFCYDNQTWCDWAVSLSLATTREISVDFFSSGYWDVSVLQVRSTTLCIQVAVTLAGWVSPFRYLRINAYLPTPRSFSQANTSFIAFYCQGIHRVHLITWPYNPKMSHSYFCLSLSLPSLFLFIQLAPYCYVTHLYSSQINLSSSDSLKSNDPICVICLWHK